MEELKQYDALSIITRAEYLANDKDGKNVHKINGLVARIYLLCYAKRFEEAEALVNELYKAVYQYNGENCYIHNHPVKEKLIEIKNKTITLRR
jgi:hypothetical protein